MRVYECKALTENIFGVLGRWSLMGGGRPQEVAGGGSTVLTEKVLIFSQEAAQTLGFTNEEKMGMYKICAACLHWGNSKFKQRPREEQAEVADPKGKSTFNGGQCCYNKIIILCKVTMVRNIKLLSHKLSGIERKKLTTSKVIVTPTLVHSLNQYDRYKLQLA